MLLWIAALAHALPPDGTPALLNVGAGEIDRMAISDAGTLVTGRSRGDLSGWILDVEDWSIQTFAECEHTGGAILDLDDQTQEVWIACGDGTARALQYDRHAQSLTPLLDDEGQAVAIPIAETLSGVWRHDELLYFLTVATDTPQVHVLDPFTFALDGSVLDGYPVSLSWLNFVEGAVVGDDLYVAHKTHEVSRVPLGVPSPGAIPSTLALAIDVRDISPSYNGGIYAVDDAGSLAEFSPVANQFNLLLGALTDPKAVVASLDPGDEWILVTGVDIKIWLLENGTIPDSTPYFEIAGADNNIQDAVYQEGYVFGGGIGGNIHVTTAHPWIYPAKLTVEPDSGTEGTELMLTFLADEAGDWAIYRGGDRHGTGTRLDDGSTGAANEEVQVPLTVDLSWDEGTNYLYVLHTNNRQLTGHSRVAVTVDNPPRPPDLSDGNVLFGDKALTLEFDGIPDLDLDYYEVYVTSAPWDGADWPTGGPEFDGSTNLKTPIRVEKAGGEAVNVKIAPLANHVTYYIGVRATDQGGLEGPMSKVVKGTPRPVRTAAELAGEQGGTPWCSSDGAAVGWLGVIAAAALVRRRQLRFARAAARGMAFVAGLSWLSASSPAEARPRWHDETPQRGDFELRYGVVDFAPVGKKEDPNPIDQVYKDNPHNILQLQFGPQLFRVVELDLGMGFFQELAFKIDDGGNQSADRTMLTWWPFALDATLRGHILDEQVLVPFLGYGFDYVIWSEKSDDGSGDKDTVRGAKIGNHYALGINVLLDVFAPRRASLLEAQTGINDSYLVIEYRKQAIDNRKFPWAKPTKGGFDFSAGMVTVGIKLDY